LLPRAILSYQGASRERPDPITFDIIIPTLGRDASLVLAVGSAVSALRPGGRIVVVNDGDVDVDGLSRREFQPLVQDGRLVVITNGGAHGASRARNLGADFSNANLLFFLDDDDVLAPGGLDDALTAAERYDYGFAIAPRGAQKDTDGAPVGIVRVRSRFAPTSAAFWIKREVFQRLGAFHPDLTVGEDFDFCARLLADRVPGWVSFRPGVIRGDFTDAMQTTSLVNRTDAAETVRCRRMLMLRNIGSFGYSDREKYYLVEQYVRRAVRSGLAMDALRHLLGLLPQPIAGYGLLIWVSNMLFGRRDP
jgi:glycosyltransferase involved in cell wall biosynthesis